MSSTAVRARRTVRAVEVFYPESDGRPMAETDLHIEITVYLREALKLWFADVANVYVSGNLMMYYVEGNSRISISPDVFVVKGAPQRRRRVYKVWEEPAPCVVIEVSSRKTKLEDLRTKFAVYRDELKVREYYIYDPERDYLPQRMRGWSLRGGDYVERRLVNGRLRSRELGLDLVNDRGLLRLMDPRTGRTLPGLLQSEEARQRAEDARQQAEGARQRADEAHQQAEDARRRAEHERQQAEDARRQAEEERGRADVARERAESELERLREENRRLREITARPRRGHRRTP